MILWIVWFDLSMILMSWLERGTGFTWVFICGKETWIFVCEGGRSLRGRRRIPTLVEGKEVYKNNVYNCCLIKKQRKREKLLQENHKKLYECKADVINRGG